MKVPSRQMYNIMMEENSGSASTSSPGAQNHNGGSGQPFGGVNLSVANNKHQNAGGGGGLQPENDSGSPGGGSMGGGPGSINKDQNTQYTMPGVLHFLQHEWARFELERSQWELDRAEFQVCFSSLSLSFISCLYTHVVVALF